MASSVHLFRPAARQLARPTNLLPVSARCLSRTASSNAELDVGEMEGISFKVAPLKRTGEDEATMRARLLYQSRKRGMREGELLLSTFAAARLPKMSVEQMQIYDRFLDENDWDIYYWATQVEMGQGPEGKDSELFEPKPAQGEWAQTIGAFRPAYRPVPSRWRGSEILAMLRDHVERQRKPEEGKQGGMAFVPDLPSKKAS